jgi:hypothetical protein
MASGIIPGVIRKKRGHFAILGPITPERIATIKQRILKFRCRPGRKKLKYVPPVQTSRGLADARFSRLNLAGILIKFEWWMNQCQPLAAWPDVKKRRVLEELVAAAAVALRLADDLKEEIPRWDGTKTQLARLRR